MLYMKKKYFVLLEILIALFIITICSIPLISGPIYFYKKEVKSLEELELQRMEKKALFEIRKLLFENKIPWDSFSNKKKSEAQVFFLKEKILRLKNFNEKKVPVYYRIWTEKEKEGENSVIYRKLGVEISFFDPFKKRKKRFTHFLFARKIQRNQ